MITLRRTVQFGFLTLTLVGVFLFRGNAERWCPFGAVEAVYTYAQEGNMLCSLGVSNFYLFAGVAVSVLLLRRAFCGYACPIGTISEWLGIIAGRLGLRALRVPSWLDRPLSLLKYLVLAVVVGTTWQAGELLLRGYGPCYALLGRHGADITWWAYLVSGVVAVTSLVVALPLCRWFCPLAAVLNPLSRFGLARVRRDGQICRGCGQCAQACPMGIPVAEVTQVTMSRCLSCLSCVTACPPKAAGALTWGPPSWWGGRWPKEVLVLLLLLCLGTAVAAVFLAPFPSFVKSHGTPRERSAVVRLKLQELTCRGRANLLVFFLERDDQFRIPGPIPRTPGYFKLEAWPGPDWAEVHIHFDPGKATEERIKQAITEPYYDRGGDRWWTSPFVIEGYSPLGLDDEEFP
jgi:polyferredoxin